MPTLTVDQTTNDAATTLFYENYGQGKPVVLIHGWPLSSRAWEKQVPVLMAEGFQVITYDRRGFGESSKPWDGYNYDRLAADLQALLEHLDLNDVTLVGFSMGGGEVARYLATYGDSRIAKAVFAGAVPPYMHKTADNPDGGIDDAGIQDLKEAVRADRLAFLDDFTKNFFGVDGKVLVSEQTRQYMQSIANFASPKGTLDCIDAFCCTDFRDNLTKISIPTLVLHGSADAIVPFEVSGQRTADVISSAKVALVDGGPHGFNVTHAEQFNKALIDFLKI